MREWLISTTAAMCIAVGKLRGDPRSRANVGRLDRSIRIIATLAHIDVVIRVDRLLGTELAAEDLDGTVRDDLRQDLNHTPARRSGSPSLPH